MLPEGKTRALDLDSDKQILKNQEKLLGKYLKLKLTPSYIFAFLGHRVMESPNTIPLIIPHKQGEVITSTNANPKDYFTESCSEPPATKKKKINI